QRRTARGGSKPGYGRIGFPGHRQRRGLTRADRDTLLGNILRTGVDDLCTVDVQAGDRAQQTAVQTDFQPVVVATGRNGHPAGIASQLTERNQAVLRTVAAYLGSPVANDQFRALAQHTQVSQAAREGYPYPDAVVGRVVGLVKDQLLVYRSAKSRAHGQAREVVRIIVNRIVRVDYLARQTQ